MAEQTFPGDIKNWRLFLFLQPPNAEGTVTLIDESEELRAQILAVYTNLMTFYNAVHGAGMLLGSAAIFLAPPGFNFQTPWKG